MGLRPQAIEPHMGGARAARVGCANGADYLLWLARSLINRRLAGKRALARARVGMRRPDPACNLVGFCAERLVRCGVAASAVCPEHGNKSVGVVELRRRRRHMLGGDDASPHAHLQRAPQTRAKHIASKVVGAQANRHRPTPPRGWGQPSIGQPTTGNLTNASAPYAPRLLNDRSRPSSAEEALDAPIRFASSQPKNMLTTPALSSCHRRSR